jgi:hypothetical protein
MEIPATVRELLWEYSSDESLIEGPAESTVVERVMQLGGWDEMRWLLKSFSRDRLRAYLEHRGRRVLAPRELRFWMFVCGVPLEEQDDWAEDARRREFEWRG